MQNKEKATLDEVLNEFVAEYEKPTVEALEKWAGLYPQFRRELVNFAAAWAEQIALPPAQELTAEEEGRLVERAMSHVQNVAFSRGQRTGPREAGDRPIGSLTGEAKKAGMSAQEFAKACGLDLVLITKLNGRQIMPVSIPSRLVSHIARLLGRSVEAVVEFLSRPPQALAGKAFLSRKKPQSPRQQSFADAVRASSLSDAEKARWLDEAAHLEER